jgi:hypothetical protein
VRGNNYDKRTESEAKQEGIILQARDDRGHAILYRSLHAFPKRKQKSFNDKRAECAGWILNRARHQVEAKMAKPIDQWSYLNTELSFTSLLMDQE